MTSMKMALAGIVWAASSVVAVTCKQYLDAALLFQLSVVFVSIGFVKACKGE